jgi:hypothetical protein
VEASSTAKTKPESKRLGFPLIFKGFLEFNAVLVIYTFEFMFVKRLKLNKLLNDDIKRDLVR